MFRFTIRDVLWLTVVAALVVGWWIDHRRLEQQAARLKTDGQLRRSFDALDAQ